jgi:hypothetical protein
MKLIDLVNIFIIPLCIFSITPLLFLLLQLANNQKYLRNLRQCFFWGSLTYLVITLFYVNEIDSIIYLSLLYLAFFFIFINLIQLYKSGVQIQIIKEVYVNPKVDVVDYLKNIELKKYLETKKKLLDMKIIKIKKNKYIVKSSFIIFTYNVFKFLKKIYSIEK